MVNKVEISYKTIIFTVVFLISIWLVIQIRDLLLLLFIAFIIMSAISPTIDKLENFRLPRVISILLFYVIGLSIIGAIASLIMPPLVTQSIRLATKLPDFINSYIPFAHLNVDTLAQQIIPVGGGVIKLSVGVFSNFVTIVTFLVFTFYFLLERKRLEKDLLNFVGPQAGEKIFTVIRAVEIKLGAWVRGELALMTIIGITSFIGLSILKVDYALPLAILAGFLELVPIIGPIVSAVPAILVALGSSPGLAIAVIALYILIQQAENNLIVPSVMNKTIGISPLVTIIALMIGGRLAGIIGALISIPLVVVLQIVIREVLKYK